MKELFRKFNHPLDTNRLVYDFAKPKPQTDLSQRPAEAPDGGEEEGGTPDERVQAVKKEEKSVFQKALEWFGLSKDREKTRREINKKANQYVQEYRDYVNTHKEDPKGLALFKEKRVTTPSQSNLLEGATWEGMYASGRLLREYDVSFRDPELKVITAAVNAARAGPIAPAEEAEETPTLVAKAGKEKLPEKAREINEKATQYVQEYRDYINTHKEDPRGLAFFKEKRVSTPSQATLLSGGSWESMYASAMLMREYDVGHRDSDELKMITDAVNAAIVTPAAPEEKQPPEVAMR